MGFTSKTSRGPPNWRCRRYLSRLRPSTTSSDLHGDGVPSGNRLHLSILLPTTRRSDRSRPAFRVILAPRDRLTERRTDVSISILLLPLTALRTETTRRREILSCWVMSDFLTTASGIDRSLECCWLPDLLSARVLVTAIAINKQFRYYMYWAGPLQSPKEQQRNLKPICGGGCEHRLAGILGVLLCGSFQISDIFRRKLDPGGWFSIVILIYNRLALGCPTVVVRFSVS